MPHPALPPDPRAWVASRITLSRAADGTMTGIAVIDGVDHHVRAWRRDGEGSVVMETQPVTDAEFEAMAAALSRRAAG